MATAKARAGKRSVREAQVSFNKATGAIQIAVPAGISTVDLFKSLARVDLSVLAKLPRGCQTCLSGHPFDIREMFDPVVNVRLRG